MVVMPFSYANLIIILPTLELAPVLITIFYPRVSTSSIRPIAVRGRIKDPAAYSRLASSERINSLLAGDTM